MGRVDRFSVSLDTELLAAFDVFIADRGYTNRSEAVRDMIRDWLASSGGDVGGSEVVLGLLSAECDQSVGPLSERLRVLLLEYADEVLGVWRYPLDGAREVMVLMLRGRADRVAEVANGVGAIRGVAHPSFRCLPVAGQAGLSA